LWENDFVVADEIDIAPCDAGFDVAGVAASADEAMKLGESQKPALAVRQMLTPVAVTRETHSDCWHLGGSGSRQRLTNYTGQAQRIGTNAHSQ